MRINTENANTVTDNFSNAQHNTTALSYLRSTVKSQSNLAKLERYGLLEKKEEEG